MAQADSKTSDAIGRVTLKNLFITVCSITIEFFILELPTADVTLPDQRMGSFPGFGDVRHEQQPTCILDSVNIRIRCQ